MILATTKATKTSASSFTLFKWVNTTDSLMLAKTVNQINSLFKILSKQKKGNTIPTLVCISQHSKFVER